jgi:hypothetical protein
MQISTQDDSCKMYFSFFWMFYKFTQILEVHCTFELDWMKFRNEKGFKPTVGYIWPTSLVTASRDPLGLGHGHSRPSGHAHGTQHARGVVVYAWRAPVVALRPAMEEAIWWRVVSGLSTREVQEGRGTWGGGWRCTVAAEWRWGSEFRPWRRGSLAVRGLQWSTVTPLSWGASGARLGLVLGLDGSGARWTMVAALTPLNGSGARRWVVNTRSPEVEREEELASGWLGNTDGGSTKGTLWLLALK